MLPVASLADGVNVLARGEPLMGQVGVAATVMRSTIKMCSRGLEGGKECDIGGD